MPQEINNKDLRVLHKDEIMLKSEFQAFVKQTLEILLAKDKKHDAKLNALSQAFQQLMADLRNQVDGLFVSDRVKKLEDDHETKMRGVDERMAKVRDGRDGKSIKGLKGDRGNDGSPDTPEMVRAKLKEAGIDAEAIEGLEEMVKKIHKEIMGNMRFGRAGGIMTPQNTLIQSIDISSQMDGFKKVFVGLPTARFYPVVYSSQAPFTLHPNVHYSIGNRSITLNNTVEAPTAGTNQFLIVNFIK